MNNRKERRCMSCKEMKNTEVHFGFTQNGHRKVTCKKCTAINKEKAKFKNCVKCKTSKPIELFELLPGGQRYNRCNDCRPVIRVQKKRQMQRKLKETKLCRKCRKDKPRDHFKPNDKGELYTNCESCRGLSPKKGPASKKTVKKDDLVINANPNSHEMIQKERLTAIQALERAKKREQEILSNGGRYVKSGIRAFVLSNRV